MTSEKRAQKFYRYWWRGTTQILVVRRIGGKFSLTNHKYYPDLGMKLPRAFIGPCPHEPGHFLNRTFFIQIRVNGALNRSGERFQNNVVSVPGFTDRKADSCKKVCGFKNVLADSCGSSSGIISWSHQWWRCKMSAVFLGYSSTCSMKIHIY